jgi:hypothetical protein
MKPERPNPDEPGMNAPSQPATGIPALFDPPAARRRARDDAGEAVHLSAEERARIIRRLRFLARLLDDAFVIPGTRISIGLDPVIGLAPGIGDVVSMAISGYIIFEGKRLGASPGVLAMMVANVAIDTLAGTIPVLGDLVDAGFKANQRNLRLLGIEPARPGEPI